jgi:hypothetical protein
MAMSRDEREIVRRSRDFQDLVNSPGFKLLQQIVQSRINAETQAMVSPDFNNQMDGVKMTKLEDRMKGAIYGMLLTVGIPQNTIDQAKQILLQHAAVDENSEEPATEGLKNNAKAP